MKTTAAEFSKTDPGTWSWVMRDDQGLLVRAAPRLVDDSIVPVVPTGDSVFQTVRAAAFVDGGIILIFSVVFFILLYLVARIHNKQVRQLKLIKELRYDVDMDNRHTLSDWWTKLRSHASPNDEGHKEGSIFVTRQTKKQSAVYGSDRLFGPLELLIYLERLVTFGRPMFQRGDKFEFMGLAGVWQLSIKGDPGEWYFASDQGMVLELSGEKVDPEQGEWLDAAVMLDAMGRQLLRVVELQGHIHVTPAG